MGGDGRPRGLSGEDAVQYWLLRRRQYPRLSRMAINLFSVPAMSSEPERIFSLTGQIVSAQRGRLKADLIGAVQCISSWERRGIIRMGHTNQIWKSANPNKSDWEFSKIHPTQIQPRIRVDLFVCKPGLVNVTDLLVLRARGTARHGTARHGHAP